MDPVGLPRTRLGLSTFSPSASPPSVFLVASSSSPVSLRPVFLNRFDPSVSFPSQPDDVLHEKFVANPRGEYLARSVDYLEKLRRKWPLFSLLYLTTVGSRPIPRLVNICRPTLVSIWPTRLMHILTQTCGLPPCSHNESLFVLIV